MSLRIRNSLDRADWAYIRELCARTGNAGAPIDPSRWPFFGEQWIGPYEKLRPEWTYIVENDGVRVGYLTGCSDTSGFLKEKRWLFDLPLYLRARLGEYPSNGDLTRFITRYRKGGWPEECFSEASTQAVLREYPAHLHMNFDAAARGQGGGRVLVERYQADLRAIGVNGIHLYCGPLPRPFYEGVGFRLLDEVEFRPGVPVYRLGSRF